jgi:3-dehydroquinate synthase
VSESFDIVAATGSYAVHIDSGALAYRLMDWRDNIIIADEYFRTSFSALQAVNTALYYPASESTKSLNEAPELIERLRRCGANRQTKIVAIGGGVIQDLTAFVASIYMRGIPWIFVPTTILAMVDSCIGGKSSINVGPYKNLVGTFHPPQEVIIDPQLARSLPVDQQASGIIEAAKICFCRGEESFHSYLNCNPHPGMETEALAQLIAHSLHAKKWFIETDEFDQKERLLLNLGHTFGHAIEGASHYSISHGIAVGLGILCAISFVRQNKNFAGDDLYSATPLVAALERHLISLLKAVPDLSQHLASLSVEEVLDRFDSDKKHRQDSYVLILIEVDGEVVLKKVAKSRESKDRIEKSVRSVVESYAS